MTPVLRVDYTRIETHASLEIVAEDGAVPTDHRTEAQTRSEHSRHSPILRRVQSTGQIIDVLASDVRHR